MKALKTLFFSAIVLSLFGSAAVGQSAPVGFSYIPVDSFTMGVTSGDTDSDAPPTIVTVSQFYIQQTETTKGEWDEVRTWALNNGYTDLAAGAGKASNHPVQTVSWWDVVKWCNARSEKEGLMPVYTVSGSVMRTGTTEPMANWSANGYRLPTEAEWEKAARGGVEGKRFPWGTDTISHAQANYYGSSVEGYDQSPINNYHPSYTAGGRPYTSPVGSFAANGYGLYDMAGNVFEFCWDWDGASYYTTSNGTTDPRGPASGTSRVLRGSGWNFRALYCRAGSRGRGLGLAPDSRIDNSGFRPARSAPLNGNANLSNLSLSNGTLSPAFTSSTTSYTASVLNSVAITVTPTQAQANATLAVRINGGAYTSVTSGSPSAALPLNVGQNTVNVRVTAPTADTKLYTVTVTRQAGPPIVASPTATSITATGATLGGNAISDNGFAITERGVIYLPTTTNADPLIGGSGVTKVSTTGTTGVFTIPVTGLTQGMGYFYKAYAINSLGTSYTSVNNFVPGPVPTIINGTATGITTTSAILGANVTNANGSAVIERGVVFALASSGNFPMIGGSGVTKVVAPGTTGEFSVPVQGLSSGTMYKFSAYAINGIGRIYTNMVQFSTISTNADLASLGVSSSTMKFNFTPASDTKIANVGVGTDGVSVVASFAHPNSASLVRINAGPFTTLRSGEPSQELGLNLGTNYIEVLVTAQDGSTQKQYQIVVVRSSNPMVSPPADQTHKVGQRLENDDSLALVVEGAFTSIEATGLPPGIRLDKTTWSLAGRPTVARKNSKGVVQPYTVKLRARGASGFGPWVSFPWTVEPMPQGLSGAFEGFAGYESLTFPVALQVRVSTSGAVTGHLRMEAPAARVAFSVGRERRVSISGLMITSQDGSSGVVEASGRLGSETWRLSLTLPTGGGATIGWLEEQSGNRFDVSAWRLNTVPEPTQTGVFHVRLRPFYEEYYEESNVKGPEGDGFARVTIGKTGLARVSGRLPDATALNISAGLGVGGELAIFAMINRINSTGQTMASGGISGQLRINNAIVEGDVRFTRATIILDKKPRIHPEGFSLSIAAEGGRFALTNDGMVLGLNAPLQANNTQLIMLNGALPEISMLTQNVSLGLRNRVTLARGGSLDNANYVTFSLNAQTGLWSGTFSYDGTSARSRRGVFQGLLIPTLNGGFGYQLLGEPANPSATPPTTDANSPQRSGAALFVKMPSTFAHIPGGVFTMGRTSGDTDSNAPPITVTVSPFYMQENETTKAQWDEVQTWAVNNGYTDLPAGAGKAEDHPVHTVTWWDVVKWCNARSEKEGLMPVYTVSGSVMRTGTTEPMANWSANGYRLPTEAEWEKAARGGVEGKRFPWGTDTISHAEANYTANSSLFSYDTSGYLSDTYHVNYNNGITPITAPAGSFSANAFGLHDMAGNVWEWCWDWYGVSSYVDGATDPRGAPSGGHRVSRGGSWYSNSSLCRAAFRNFNTPSDRVDGRGFRPARSSP